MMRRFALIALLAILLSACAAPVTSPIETLPTSQITRIAIASATSPPTPTYTAEEARRERLLPLLLTLDDFEVGVNYGAQSLTDNVTNGIQNHAMFTDGVGYVFVNEGSEFLGGLTGFLDSQELVADFDASAMADLDALMAGFLADVLDPEDRSLTEADQALALENSLTDLPADVHALSQFGYSSERLVRLDAIAFRRGNVAVYLLAVSVLKRDPLIDISAIISVLEERLSNYASDTF
jgi:hypothetical protein